jgi:hypothetical protein
MRQSNKIKKNEKEMGEILQEWAILPGIELTCLGILKKEEGTGHKITINSTGKLQIREESGEIFMLTRDSPAEVYTRYETARNFWFWGTVLSLTMGVGLAGAGIYNRRQRT